MQPEPMEMYHDSIGRRRRSPRLAPSLATAFAALALSPAAGLTAGFSALDIEPDARSAARGESSLADVAGLAAIRLNPAGLASSERDEAGFVYLDHVLDVSFLAAGWAGSRWGGWHLGLRAERLDWGDLDGYDADGASTGGFDAGDTRLGAAVARGWQDVGGGRLQAGLGAGLLFSRIDDAEATVLGLDLGVQWKRGGLSLGGAARNLGTVLSDYGDAGTGLPTRLELGLAYGLEHLPFTWSFAWSDPADGDAFLKLGGEFLLAQRWHLGFGYDAGRGDDRLSGVDGESLRGFSAGVGGDIPGGFRFHWAWSSYGELGSLNRFSLGYTF